MDTNNSGKLQDVISWLTQDELDRIYTSTFWNNIEEEKKKEWWILGGQYEECMAYLQTQDLMADYKVAENELLSLHGSVEVVDLAAGIEWTSALLSLLDPDDFVGSPVRLV